MPHEPEGNLASSEDIKVSTDGIKRKRLPDGWLDDLTAYFQSKGYTPNDTAHALLFYSIWLHLEHGTRDGFIAWLQDLDKESIDMFKRFSDERSGVQP